MERAKSKIYGALAAATQETTVALANINFDFSLYKVEAPKEYQGLGEALSKQRREAAEVGSEHVFARKLGALFAEALPATPNLIRAYGERCSEIARSPAAHPSTGLERTLFRNYIGADATSIWAAATSGRGAIEVHLLACMLARLWTSAEATAIWYELIEGRKHELSKLDPSEPLHVPLFAASRVEINREHISRWDASARAWLAVADSAKEHHQTQLMLLIRNSSVSIPAEKGVYSSVMSAWRTTMETVEKILNGVSQTISDGGVLLGLVSWHLYPNLYALDAAEKAVVFKDPLVPSNVLVTLGSISSSTIDGSGVRWSLPLAYLRYYGDPIITSRVMVETSGRLSMQECLQVFLGAVLSGWGPHGDDLEQACSIVMELSDAVHLRRKIPSSEDASWLQRLSEAAETYRSSTGIQHEHYGSLISRGKRRYATFLAQPQSHPKPLFGIHTVKKFIQLISHHDNKVSALRFIAKSIERSLDCQPSELLIRYRRPDASDMNHDDTNDIDNIDAESDTSGDMFPRQSNTTVRFTPPLGRGRNYTLQRSTWARTAFGRAEHPSYADFGSWEYATALKINHNPKKRKLVPEDDLTGHTRWVVEGGGSVQNGERYFALTSLNHLHSGSDTFDWYTETNSLDQEQDDTASEFASRSFECILGDYQDAAIYCVAEIQTSQISEEIITPDLVMHALRQGWINHSSLIRHLNRLGNPGAETLESSNYDRALRALAAAANIYKLMPGATIHPGIFTRPLADSKWIPQSQSTADGFPPWRTNDEWSSTDENALTTYRLSREQTMACIARFENVEIDLEPEAFTNVMAISSGNSIYVPAPLISDPYDQPRGYEMKHILGNIGKPGVSLMIPPLAPRVRKVNDNVWVHVNHCKFDGNFDDSFQHTSLHLSFTEYQLPVGTNSLGSQSADAYLVESVVSIFDRTEWVADLDILKALDQSCLKRVNGPKSCQHTIYQPRFPLVSIDSWEEYLDRPLVPAIFRSRDNWLARLAITALNAQNNHPTILFQNKDAVCWHCVASRFEDSWDVSLFAHRSKESLPIFVC